MKTITFFTFTSVDSNGNLDHTKLIGNLGNFERDDILTIPSVNDDLIYPYPLENNLQFVGIVYKVVERIGLGSDDKNCVDIFCKGVVEPRI